MEFLYTAKGSGNVKFYKCGEYQSIKTQQYKEIRFNLSFSSLVNMNVCLPHFSVF